MGKFVSIEKYLSAKELKDKLDKGEITIEELSLEEIEEINKLYEGEINVLFNEIKVLREENIKLRINKGVDINE